ncbi:DedA family protein [Hoyosella altamirensis]|uniref:Membrane protein DedA with SNARE-associated domain n=1 Tax=Hoyosella altamirensis TaxID=616997 RepID=A0A839RTH5_9ACTN|nr:VTT domain-containing protein [Hoyosella altamirensis]MBB3039518.1 membrane protein DedA with SNARE-associated domain [Hoyosella altamirensis]
MEVHIVELFHGLAAQHPGLVAVIFAALMMVHTTAFVGPFVPGDITVLIAGVSIDHPAQLISVILAGIAGCLLGATSGFFLGAVFGSRIKEWAARHPRWHRAWERTERYLHGGGGGPLIALAIVLPLMHCFAPFIAAAHGISYRRVIAWWAIGAAVWIGIFASFGAIAGGLVRSDPGAAAAVAGIVAAVVVAVVLGIHTLLQRRLAD